MIDYRVYLVTDDPSRYSGDWIENIRAAVEGGVTCVQYRDTESAPAVRYERLRRLKGALVGTPIIVNNDAELAKAVGAEGVHVGQSDLPPRRVREIVGPNCEIGYSITDFAQLTSRQDEIAVCDCLGIGPVFDATKTKADASAAIGVDGLARIVEAARGLPSVAIGGITLANAAEVLSSGVGGLAVVSAFSKSENSYETAKKFRLLFDDRRK